MLASSCCSCTHCLSDSTRPHLAQVELPSSSTQNCGAQTLQPFTCTSGSLTGSSLFACPVHSSPGHRHSFFQDCLFAPSCSLNWPQGPQASPHSRPLLLQEQLPAGQSFCTHSPGVSGTQKTPQILGHLTSLAFFLAHSNTYYCCCRHCC